ncbi:purine-cytosine permease family protein [Geodermatophilus sp. CPCC 205761]|uniref:purine-cytosine permease family protein n=1 Tax=Geodermatophilus sp. CPCC 205761 TaxID=2936597 RepID=UPI003EE84A10
MALAPDLSAPPLTTRSTDDPDVVARQLADDYSNHVVPLTARVGRWQLTMSFWSLLSAMVWLFYGALASTLFGTRDALIAIGLSVVTYSLINWLFTRWGARSGLNSTLLSRRMFGVVGASLTALLIAANTTYYAVFESSTLAVAFQHYTPSWDIRVWYAVIALAMLPLMLGSVQTWMAKLNGFLLPFYAVGVIAAVIAAAVRFPDSGWLGFEGVVPPEARALPGWLLGTILYMGIYLTMPTTVDFARFAKVQDEGFHKNVTFGWVFYAWLFAANGAAGIFLVRAALPGDPTAETGVVEAIIAALGFVGLLLIVVSQTRINSLNYYLASSNWERLLTNLTGLRLRRVAWVVVTTVVVFLLMLTNVFSYLQQALSWQGVFLVAWVGIALTHFALVREDRDTPEFRATRLPKVTWGLAVWVVSAGVGIFLLETTSVPALFTAAAQVVALVLSVVLYAVVVTVLPPRVRTGLDPRQEVPDAASTWIECHVCEDSYVAVEMDRDPGADDAPVCDACATGHRRAHQRA